MYIASENIIVKQNYQIKRNERDEICIMVSRYFSSRFYDDLKIIHKFKCKKIVQPIG